ncbi:unnamed protein product [Natator depressus]
MVGRAPPSFRPAPRWHKGAAPPGRRPERGTSPAPPRHRFLSLPYLVVDFGVALSNVRGLLCPSGFLLLLDRCILGSICKRPL